MKFYSNMKYVINSQTGYVFVASGWIKRNPFIENYIPNEYEDTKKQKEEARVEVVAKAAEPPMVEPPAKEPPVVESATGENPQVDPPVVLSMPTFTDTNEKWLAFAKQEGISVPEGAKRKEIQYTVKKSMRVINAQK